MRYVRAKCDEAQETYLFREYVTETMRLHNESKYISTPWHDFVTKQPVDTRTGDDIALEVIACLGLSIGKEGTEDG